MSIILFLVFGLVVGALARFIVRGRDPRGFVISMVVGVAGSFLGGFLGRALGWYQDGQPAGFVMSLIGAALLVVAFHAISRRSAFA
jgi:uncharacterized membrane protein YeaQ/YmgE (transglycosylase-associated protein family)